ncbi:MAG TPA: O-methyltransferase [Candidatus Polarisedimenticolia bacterium]|nr:O-methyltransferase [Candidatus Polarisedimenticolia bacterium]
MPLDILDPRIEQYLRELLPAPDPIRAEMERIGAERKFPIIGPLVGNLCGLMAASIGARKVFEMGSGFGYSTLWFARAVGPEGLVVHTEGSAENSKLARDFLTRAGLADRVRFEVGDAREILDREIAAGRTLPFDVVFNDMDKEQYPDALPRARKALRQGGLLICDNMLWFGRVLEGSTGQAVDHTTRGILELTRMLREAPDFVTTLIPIRDGVTVSLRTKA